MDWYVYERGSSPIRRVTRKRGFWSKRFWLIILAALVIMGLLWGAFALWNINRAATTNPMNQADAGIILGMSMWGDEPSPGLQERLDYGLKLYQAGKFSHIIVTGGLDQADLQYTEAQGMRNYLVKQGVPDSAIYMENKATSTYENLLFSKEIMNREGLSTAIIITHTYHGRRAQEIADELGYNNPELGLTDSQVLSMARHKTREVLAYTKWKLQQLFL
ncbi:YdcF family protein [Paenibacillus sp. 19GGS1-52]|uniref:YdcF family protein n=1 Tax=Paenibacillus sp. 19GGS1-52 TaxID=2758563 RepID=UPI001EFA5760|nr:YdcF family protein [Paenibacillus sp. 19GGS1-52]ULO09986.1 YdcF family protein [Paenibacillus sp. 19GGS1-52]